MRATGWWGRVASTMTVCRTTATSSWDPLTPHSTAINIQSHDSNSSGSNDNNFTYDPNCCVCNGGGLGGGAAYLSFQHKILSLNGKIRKRKKAAKAILLKFYIIDTHTHTFVCIYCVYIAVSI